jgi:hypothetical protein
MKTYTDVPVKNFTSLSRHEPIIVDSTSMMTFKTCPRKYFYRIILGYVPKGTAPYFAYGSAYHVFRDVLETTYKSNKDYKKCFEAAFLAALTYWQKHGEEPVVGTRWDFLTQGRLVKTCQVAYEHWKKEKEQNKIIVIANEQPFVIAMPDGTLIAGRFDQIIRWNGKPWGRDFKTSSKMGAYYQRTLEPNDQFTRYTYAQGKLTGEYVQGQVVEVMYNTKSAGPKIEQFTTSRSRDQLETWEEEHEFWVSLLKICRDTDNYPMNEKSCSFCEYHSVCKQPSESSMMYQLDNYYNVKPWDCTVNPKDGEESEES